MTILEVYEEYKHLDHLLSDPTWVECGGISGHMLGDFWGAIKKHLVLEAEKQALSQATAAPQQRETEGYG